MTIAIMPYAIVEFEPDDPVDKLEDMGSTRSEKLEITKVESFFNKPKSSTLGERDRESSEKSLVAR